MGSIHFLDTELRCKCGCNVVNMDPDFMSKLETLRQLFGKKMKLDSAFRCKTWNQKVGGAPDSQHLYGRAVDVAIHDDADRYRLFSLAVTCGFSGIGVHHDFIHIDTRPGPRQVMWVYASTAPQVPQRTASPEL